MKKLTLFLLACLLFANCKKDNNNPGPCNGTMDGFSATFGIASSLTAVNENNKMWLFLSNEEGQVVRDSQILVNEEFVLSYEADCETDVDVTQVFVQEQENPAFRHVDIHLHTFTNIEGGVQKSTGSSGGAFTSFSKPVVVLNIPEDIESAILPELLGYGIPNINKWDNTVTFEGGNGSALSNYFVVYLKRASEEIYRAAIVELIDSPTIQRYEIDYAQFEYICETKTITAPYEEDWNYFVMGLLDGVPKNNILLAPIAELDTEVPVSSSFELLVPITDRISPIGVTLTDVSPDASPYFTYKFTDDSLPTSFPLINNTFAHDRQDLTLNITGGQEWGYLEAVWSFLIPSQEGLEVAVRWEVYLDHNQHSSYTLPDLPASLLEAYPFLEDLSEVKSLLINTYRYEDGTSYNDIKDHLWQKTDEGYWWLEKKGETTGVWYEN